MFRRDPGATPSYKDPWATYRLSPEPPLHAPYILYPVSLPALRIALRTHLRDADALTYVLSLLIGWLDQWTAEDVALLPEETTKDAHGALVPVYPASKLEIPPMDKVRLSRTLPYPTPQRFLIIDR